MEWYEVLAQILLIGTANGALIALVALGYTLVYGIIELINFAHGDVSMMGTMLALTLVTWVPFTLGIGSPLAMPPGLLVAVLAGSFLLCVAGCALMNAAIERLAYRRVRQ